ncbi:DUF4856 domain-containing protein [Nemorincola caseinilytica]|uniref:DUF4856 domain-containing protein n=1 Tax=Nemorincola caseinilytica TaxID=2054315 RepID=A0ABP8N5X1_9BACT
MNKKLVLSVAAASMLFGACKKDKETTPEEKVPYASLTATTSYFTTFKGTDGNTSVDFSGQTTRISMMKEMDAYIKTFSTAALDATKLKNMYANTGSPFSDAALNSATDKTIISKTAQSFATADADAERNWFKACFDSVALASTHASQTAAIGVPGKLGNYLVNAKGFEYGQFIQKGLMGAMMLDQISNIYLGTEKMAADNNTIVSGKNYTALEHHWDEAYGYLTANEYYPKPDPNDATKWLESYLGSYVRQVNGTYGDPTAVYLAFLKGRAAVVNKDMTTRDAQIASIRTALEKAVATVAVSYLNKTKTATTDAARFHSLSEGMGFLYSLRFAHNAKVNRAKSEELMGLLMNKTNGFWSLTNADLDTVRDQIATACGIDKEAVVNH